MSAGAPGGGTLGGPDEVQLTPEEEDALRIGIERIHQEKLQALRDPGPGWKEWFLFDGAKWWVGLLYLVVDSWIVGLWFERYGVTGTIVVLIVLSLVAALYLELLAFRYLWRRPADDEHVGSGVFRPGPFALREVGIWTPEAKSHLASRLRRGPEGAPDPHDFL